MHGGEVDEGYCIANSDALEDSMTASAPSHRTKNQKSRTSDRTQ